MNGISLETFRAIVGNQSIGAEDKLAIGDEARTTLVPDGAERTFSAGNPNDDSRYMRSQLLMRAGFALVHNPDVFGKIQDKLFGGAGKGDDVSLTPLSKREIAEVIKMTDEAMTDTKRFTSPKWKTGVPELKPGVVLKQSTGNNTCFMCSVLNGIANSPKLAAHFESLVDRTKTPPTIKLYTKDGTRVFSFDETFELPEKTLKSIAGNGATEFEKFLMRYLAANSEDDPYIPGNIHSDEIVARALGLVSAGQGMLIDDPPPPTVDSKPQTDKPAPRGVTLAWSRLVVNVKAGGFATLNYNGSHFASIVAANDKGCMVTDSMNRSPAWVKKEKALEWFREKTIPTLYNLLPEAKVKAFKSELENLSADDIVISIQNVKSKVVREANQLYDSLRSEAPYKGIVFKSIQEFHAHLEKNPPNDKGLRDKVEKFRRYYAASYSCVGLTGRLKADRSLDVARRIKEAFEKNHFGNCGLRYQLAKDFDLAPEKARSYVLKNLERFLTNSLSEVNLQGL